VTSNSEDARSKVAPRTSSLLRANEENREIWNCAVGFAWKGNRLGRLRNRSTRTMLPVGTLSDTILCESIM